ncbi:MAG: ATP-binding cassette domain-containing protein [Spirochaetaceae bacterium]|jgi:zinc transport system ATP-binding protein|nr:ATP-binding cassette domain-containing protein [Spirochaetaceae bacterium]
MNNKHMRTLFYCHDLCYAYDDSIVLSGLDFSVVETDYICIAGENGAGKSTLVKGLLGLIKPASGAIKADKSLRRGTGYLPQQTAAQKNFPAGAEEVVLSGLIGRKKLPFYTRSDKKTAYRNMERLGIADAAGRCFGELSGGQQRRVLVARALCAAEKLLVLDEPAAGLDPLAAREMYSLLENINRDMKMTIIMVSHDIATAVKHANKVLHLWQKQLFFGSAGDYANSGIGKAFLGKQEQ